MKFRVELEWSGYSRGISTYIVEADDEESAKENWYTGARVSHEVVRDDTEKDNVRATILIEEKEQ